MEKIPFTVSIFARSVWVRTADYVLGFGLLERDKITPVLAAALIMFRWWAANIATADVRNANDILRAKPYWFLKAKESRNGELRALHKQGVLFDRGPRRHNSEMLIDGEVRLFDRDWKRIASSW
jgi:hypothetical protein